jgi:hypothetical protein
MPHRRPSGAQDMPHRRRTRVARPPQPGRSSSPRSYRCAAATLRLCYEVSQRPRTRSQAFHVETTLAPQGFIWSSARVPRGCCFGATSRSLWVYRHLRLPCRGWILQQANGESAAGNTAISRKTPRWQTDQAKQEQQRQRRHPS